MMTPEERIQALIGLGYLEREARFLCLAALHSGFFLRRQYRAYLEARPGYADDLLVAKLLEKGHAHILTFAGKTHVCHLCSRSFFAAIGEEDNRHRRLRPATGIRVKLMALDYVLSHPQNIFLATESEKVDYFCRTLHLAARCLPTKIYRSKSDSSVTERHFVDKFPIAVPAEKHSASSVVSFCYIDEGSVSTPAFETWLAQYSGLFSALGRFRVVYVATRETNFARAQRCFRVLFTCPSASSQTDPGSSRERLLHFFRLEHAFRNGRYEMFDAVKLDELRQLRKEFCGRRIERLFCSWQRNGDEVVVRYFEQTTSLLPPTEAEFETCRLPWDYGVFETGTFTGSNQYGGRRQKAQTHPII